METSSGLVQLGGKRAFGLGVDEKRGEGSKGVFEQDKKVYFARYTGAEAGLNRVSLRSDECRGRVSRATRGRRRRGGLSEETGIQYSGKPMNRLGSAS